jgi:methionyl-tRNA formyltransferase
VVFFGSPSFALPSLEALLTAGHRIPLVVSQPGKPVGRKGDVTDPPVAARAKSLGIHVFQPATLKDDAAVERLAQAGADVFVVVAYGRILAKRVLDLPRLASLNVHGSLLPRWRGASPVQAAILAGDPVTGVSIMRMDAGMDTGPVYAMRETRIGEEEDSTSLGARLAQIGADLLTETLVFLEGEEGRGPLPQDSALATYCPKISREDARVDWERPAAELVRRGRAYTPWPGLFTLRRKTRLKLSGLSQVARDTPGARGSRESPGVLLEAGSRVVVACGEGAVSIATLQAEGKKPLAASEFVRGERIARGERWG